MITNGASGSWVLLNEAAHHRRAGRLWARIEPALSKIAPVETVRLDAAGQWRLALASAIETGHRHFVAAGGDGTVGSLFDALYRLLGVQGLKDISFGAVGLGSSNDFHKPFANVHAGVPVRVDRGLTTMRDIGLLSYVDDRDRPAQRCFAVSASVGVVARANALFNAAKGLIGLLKPHSVELAIAAAAAQAVLSSRNQRLRIASAQLDRQMLITNLSIAKTRHLAGSLTYDEQVTQNDGLLAVNLCDNMSRWELLGALRALRRGQFGNRPKTLSFSAADVSLESQESFDLEIDGEVLRAKSARFEVLPQKVRVCS